MIAIDQEGSGKDSNELHLDCRWPHKSEQVLKLTTWVLHLPNAIVHELYLDKDVLFYLFIYFDKDVLKEADSVNLFKTELSF